MKIKDIKTGEALTVNASYGARLIEQGRAVAAEPEKKAVAKKEKEAAAKPAGDA